MSWFAALLVPASIAVLAFGVNAICGAFIQEEVRGLTAHATGKLSDKALKMLSERDRADYGEAWVMMMTKLPTPLSRLWFAGQIRWDARRIARDYAREEARLAEERARAQAIEDAAYEYTFGGKAPPADSGPVSIFTIALHFLSPFGPHRVRAFVTVSIMAMSLVCYGLSSEVAAARAALAQANAKIDAVTKHTRMLELEVATRANPANLQRIAEKDLGLEVVQLSQVCDGMRCAKAELARRANHKAAIKGKMPPMTMPATGS